MTDGIQWEEYCNIAIMHGEEWVQLPTEAGLEQNREPVPDQASQDCGEIGVSNNKWYQDTRGLGTNDKTRNWSCWERQVKRKIYSLLKWFWGMIHSSIL